MLVEVVARGESLDELSDVLRDVVWVLLLGASGLGLLSFEVLVRALPRELTPDDELDCFLSVGALVTSEGLWGLCCGLRYDGVPLLGVRSLSRYAPPAAAP